MAEEQIIIYQSSSGETTIDVKLHDETVWLTQGQMQILFDQTKQNISLHINNIFKEGELTTAKDGKKYKVRHYSLDVIISVEKLYMILKINLEVAHYLGMKKMNHLKDLLRPYIKHLAVLIYTPALKKKRPTFYISWLKTILFPMATNA